MGYEKIAELTTPTSDVLDFTGLSLSGYDDIQVRVEGIVVGTDNVALVAQFVIGGSLITSGYRWHVWAVNSGGTQNTDNSTSAASMTLTRSAASSAIGNASGETFAGIYSIGNTNEAMHKFLRGHAAYTDSAGNLRHVRSLGHLANTGTLDGIKFSLSSGTMTAGKAVIWGMPNS